MTLTVPPLRNRPSDLALLGEHYLERFCREHGRSPKRLSRGALEVLGTYPWPGNVRELKNILESIVIFHEGEEILPGDLPAQIRSGGGSVTATAGPMQPISGTPLTMAEIEKRVILETLERTGGRRAEAAGILQIGLRTLQRKLKEYREQGLLEE